MDIPVGWNIVCQFKLQYHYTKIWNLFSSDILKRQIEAWTYRVSTSVKMAAQIGLQTSQHMQPVLLSKIEDDTQDVVTGAVFTPNEDGIISVSEDK